MAEPTTDDIGIVGWDAQGKPVMILVNGAPVNPCYPDPEMLVTVTGASGTINWCGQTWNLPADSGVTKTVCPTGYLQTKYYQGAPPASYPNWVAFHSWFYGTSLQLSRAVKTSNRVGGYKRDAGNNGNNLRFKSTRDLFVFGGPYATARPAPITYTNTYYSSLSIISGVNPPQYTDYLITDDFFGSHTIGGVTYTWAKGNGWPT